MRGTFLFNWTHSIRICPPYRSMKTTTTKQNQPTNQKTPTHASLPSWGDLLVRKSLVLLRRHPWLGLLTHGCGWAVSPSHNPKLMLHSDLLQGKIWPTRQRFTSFFCDAQSADFEVKLSIMTLCVRHSVASRQYLSHIFWPLFSSSLLKKKKKSPLCAGKLRAWVYNRSTTISRKHCNFSIVRSIHATKTKTASKMSHSFGPFQFYTLLLSGPLYPQKGY